MSRGIIDQAMDKIADSLPLFCKTLWSGSAWSSGSKTITDSSKYLLFLVTQANNPVLVIRNSATQVYGIGLTGNSSNNNQYTKAFYATCNGDTWTLGYAKEITHTASGSHSAGVSQSVTKVVGLVPILEGGGTA